MAGRIRIGEILLNAGVIDQHQLNAALGEQRRWGRPLGATLVKMGLIDERDLVRALASQLSLPVASLEGKRIPAEVLELVPAEMARERMVLPLFVKHSDRRTTLFLAMEDPGDLAILDDLAFRTGFQVKPVMMGPSELCEGIDRYYRDAEAEKGRAASPTGGTPQPQAPDAHARVPVPEATPDPVRTQEQPAAASPAADAGDVRADGGTAELVRHFKGGLSDAAPDIDSTPPTAPSTTSPSASASATSSATSSATTVSPAASAAPAKFDESALAAPPPREQRAGQVDAPPHPPVESLASYDARTRTILHVLTQLLIEKGVISRDELHARVSALAAHDLAQRGVDSHDAE